MAKLRFNRRFNINRVVKRLVYTVLALYVGGTIMTTFGTVMNCTDSVFYEGLTLIGWTVTDSYVRNASQCSSQTAGTFNNVITSVSGSGVLAVVGIIAIAQIVTEFVSW